MITDHGAGSGGTWGTGCAQTAGEGRRGGGRMLPLPLFLCEGGAARGVFKNFQTGAMPINDTASLD